MQKRTGEKVGWIGGWFGSFLWGLILSILWLAKGRIIAGLIGIALFLLAATFILVFSPWRHPETRYWKLMVPVYAVFFATIAWAVGSMGGWSQLGLRWWSLVWVLPALSPFGTVGSKRWQDHGG